MVNLQSWFEFLRQWYFEKFCVSILTASWAAWIASFWSLNFWFTSLVEEFYKNLVNRGCATIPCSSKSVRNRRAQMVAMGMRATAMKMRQPECWMFESNVIFIGSFYNYRNEYTCYHWLEFGKHQSQQKKWWVFRRFCSEILPT